MATVTFAIPLRRPNSVADRKRLDLVLGMTLRSVFNQTDPDFCILIAAAHKPELPAFIDNRLQVIDFPGFQAESWLAANIEAGRRRNALALAFADLGGGYLMHLDHDDFVSRRLVEHVKATEHPFGYIMQHGYLYDATKNVISPYPLKGFERYEFHRFCGTSALLRYTPQEVRGTGDGQPSLYDRVHKKGHHHIFDQMRLEGRLLEALPFPGAVYVRNAGGNLSPHATEPGGEGAKHWVASLDAAAIANRITDDAALREEFAIPIAYPPKQSASYAFAQPISQPSLSILICTHKRPEGLRRLLDAVVPQLAPSREIIVVNDGTHDEAYAKIASDRAVSIRYRALKKNVGVAAARNTAARMATGDYLVFTDDDCEPPPFWLDWLAARLSEHPELELVAGTTRPLWPQKPGFFARVRAVHELIPTTARADGTIIFPTAIVAIRRELFEAMKGFGFPGFVGAGEDTELASRLSARGVPAIYDPLWFTRHEVSEGILGLCRRYRRYGFANGRLIALTTSPVAHDYMQTTWRSNWRTIWRWEFKGRLAAARAVHRGRTVAWASATLACIVKMAYWQGVKDAFAPGAGS